MATAWRVLVLAVILVHSAHTFLPNLELTPPGTENTRTHESITKDGVLSIALKVFQDLAQQKGKVLDVAALKGDLMAEEIFKLYYGVPVSTKRFKMALDEIIRSNNEVDFLLPDDAKSHSEAEKFKEAKMLILEKKKQTISNIIKERYPAARTSLGGLLHTLQDFYSHSNWIELGNVDNTNKGMTLHNDIIGVTAGSTEKTCGPCSSSAKCDPILTPILRAEKLTSGYPNAAVPDGKCAHGGDSRPGINKDTTSPAMSPQHHLHQDAARLALKATEEVLQDIRESVDGPLFVKFLELEPPSTISFVIDTTGSMSDDILAAKERVFSIIESKKGTLNEPSVYVLVPFNDPDFGPALITDNPEEFKTAIEQLVANGGGDTPEMCLSGLQLALLSTPPDSEIYVFTDAVAKDYELKNRVLTLCQETRSKVTFLLTDAYSRRKRRSSGNMRLTSSRTDDATRSRGCGRSSVGSRGCEARSRTRSGTSARGRTRRSSWQPDIRHRRPSRLDSSYLSAEYRQGAHLRRLHPGTGHGHRSEPSGSLTGLGHSSRATSHHMSQSSSGHQGRIRRQSSESDFSLYQDIALTSGGQFISSTKSELSSVTKIIEDSVSFSTVTLLQLRKSPPTPPQNFTFNIDSSVSNVSLYITGKPQFSLFNPAGASYTGVAKPSPIASSQVAGSLERVILTSPVQPGTWTLQVTSAAEFTVRVTGDSLVDLTYDFVEEVRGTHPGFMKISGRPRAGAPANMLVRVSGLKTFPTVSLNSLYLTDIQGTIQQQLPLNRTASPDTFRAVSNSLPRDQFLVILNGVDGARNTLQRVSPSLNTISASRVQLLNTLTSLYPGEKYEIPFTVNNSGSESNFTILVQGGEGFVSEFHPHSIRLSTNQAVNGSVKLNVPASTEPGTLLTLTVQSETADKSDFNYAFLQLAVSQKVTDFDPPLCNITSLKQNCSSLTKDHCSSLSWSMEAKISDNGTRIEKIYRNFRNSTLILKEQEKAETKEVRVIQTISCCFNEVDITAVDTVGNVGKCEVRFEFKSSGTASVLSVSSALLMLCSLLCGVLIIPFA
ncbi:von Willebrand factor A domain-containing protein 7-like isoform X1 [Pleurodeles waltl]|uniref:von Willebrand factor A domain-containing protein 7-like isoform X1 n=1 Tax=Pleurodeles waltl TaxID=8319 RepID=UPI0037098A36